MFRDVSMILGRMGLKDKDATVYLVCLHFKEGLFVHEITKQTKMNRSTVDVVLKRLIEMGFMSKVKVGSRYKFIAQSPESILFKQEATLEEFKTILPVLSRLGADKTQTEIRFFEGKDGIREIYDDVLLQLKFAEGERRQLVGFDIGPHLSTVFPDIQKKFIDKRIRMKIWYKGIVPQSAVGKNEYAALEKDLRQVKFVDDKKFPFKVNFQAYADSVHICSTSKPYGGVIIKNRNIADSMRALFNLTWGLLPD